MKQCRTTGFTAIRKFVVSLCLTMINMCSLTGLLDSAGPSGRRRRRAVAVDGSDSTLLRDATKSVSRQGERGCEGQAERQQQQQR